MKSKSGLRNGMDRAGLILNYMMEYCVKPLKNYVLVVDAGEDQMKTAGGLILTQAVETGSKPGFIINVGPDVKNVNKADKIALDWGKGMPVTIENEKAILISEDFIYAVY
jgi:co-chaperonin GroES (HSP10)